MSFPLVADPDADHEGALALWRRFRRKKRLADIHWIDALYQAYVTAIVGAAVIGVVAGIVGGDPLSAPAVGRLMRHAAAWVGLLAATAVAVGLRSGSRGGPLALERADVRHVLLAPVDRTTALRGPAWRQLRFLLFVSVVVGLVAGDLAAQRLPGSLALWLLSGALFSAACVALGYGAALVANGIGMARWIASLLGFALVTLAALDGTGVFGAAPSTPAGRIALWPVTFAASGLAPMLAAVALVAAGFALVGNVSLEAAERRSTLVGQLRFAATLQDLRTVIVLRRQLAMELPRVRPWIRLSPRPGRRLPVFGRGVRSVLRWPAVRAGRAVLLGIVGGAALRAAWSGAVPLVVGAGLAVFVAGLDAVEPLAQEVDHPTRRDSAPIEAGSLHLRHVPVATLLAIGVALVAAGTSALPGPGEIPVAVAAVLFVPLALGGVAGALVSLLGGEVIVQSDTWNLMPPEVAGMRLAMRTAWPPLLAISGALPVVAARAAERSAKIEPAAAAAAAGAGVVLLFALVAGWVRMREQIHEWWRTQMNQALPPRTEQEPAGA